MTPSGPKLDFIGASETIITVAFNPLNSHDNYELQWKEYPQKWENDGQSKTINAKEVGRTGNNKIQTNIEDLNPGTTYTVRLRVLSVVASEESTAPGKPSPELIIDTEAVSCTPKASQCIIL
mmetsp:Transcript_19749/g.31997  ORF Transcript_19749/g.31997 Transcript_19749/m.31997 type:complete len:122 (+) Transcript_19749:118-483(+)|eukprot:CAMPEP_0196133848 /NCGR_PEP_ID=MMETSP0910-20130528/2891_1 /TAXON_ID=49265 /ORGANISM="Thalassiosira rotula, Strain GSO102" /LENGTH=121 /DNA_ID=CAMNT_0041393603 /DNA_START=118 /DNA_END=483 /DNA_ORIENTATION=+